MEPGQFDETISFFVATMSLAKFVERGLDNGDTLEQMWVNYGGLVENGVFSAGNGPFKPNLADLMFFFDEYFKQCGERGIVEEKGTQVYSTEARASKLLLHHISRVSEKLRDAKALALSN